MLAGEGAYFLYTAVFPCKAPPDILSIYIVIQGGAGRHRASSRTIERSRRALTFLAREHGLLTSALKKFETVRLARPYRAGREIANSLPLNDLRIRARAQKFEIRPVRGAPFSLRNCATVWLTGTPS